MFGFISPGLVYSVLSILTGLLGMLTVSSFQADARLWILSMVSLSPGLSIVERRRQSDLGFGYQSVQR
jgi:hypothetical protein